MQGESLFTKKLIPHVYMSKDEFPSSVTPDDLLARTFEFIDDWKAKLYDMLSFNTASLVRDTAQQVKVLTYQIYLCRHQTFIELIFLIANPFIFRKLTRKPFIRIAS